MSLSQIGKKILSRSQCSVHQTRAISRLVDVASSTSHANHRHDACCFSSSHQQPKHKAARRNNELSSFTSTSLTKNFLEIPRHGTLQDKIKFIVSSVPAGMMSKHHVGFCHECLFDFSAQRVVNKGHLAESILERLELEASLRGSEGILSAAHYARTIRALARTDENPKTEETESTSPSTPPFLRAKAILDRMIEQHPRKPNAQPAPDIYVYDAVLFACSRTQEFGPDAAQVARELLDSLEQNLLNRQKEDDDDNKLVVIPTTTTYNNALHMYSKIAGKVYGAAAAAEDLLLHFSTLSADGIFLGSDGKDAKPNTASFNSVLCAWAESAEEKGADRALEILHFMVGIGEEHRRVLPDAVSFGNVINAFARRKRPEEATAVYDQAIEFFNQHGKEQDSRSKEVIDLTGCFNAVLSAWSEIGDGERTEALFQDAKNYSNQQDKGIETGFRIDPETRSYRYVVNAYLASEQEDAFDKAHECLKNMIVAFEKGKGPPPDQGIFHSILWEFGKKPKSVQVAMDAEALLHSMIRLSREHRVDCAPSTLTFIRCLRFWAKQPYNSTSANHVLQLFKLAEEHRKLKRSTFEIVINYLAAPKTSVETALILERLPGHIKSELKSDQIAGMGLITKTLLGLAKVKSAVAAEHSVRLLRVMQDLELPITSKTYTIVVSSFSMLNTKSAANVVCLLLEELKQADANPNTEIRFMDSLIFSLVLEILASVGTKESADKACEIVNDMFQLCSTGRPEIEPDERSLAACLRAMCAAATPENAKQAAQLVSTLHSKTNTNGQPFLVTYSGIKNVLDCCIEAGLEKEAAQIQKILDVESYRGKQVLRVDNMIASTEKEREILTALVSDDQPGGRERADQLLKEIVIAFQAGKAPPPKQSVFFSVVNAWCNTQDVPEAGLKAEALLREMIRLSRDFRAPTAPSASIFARCIRFWRKRPHDSASVESVLRLFSLAEHHRSLNHHIYQHTIECLAINSSAMQAGLIMERLPAHVESGLLKLEEQTFARLFTKTIAALGRVKSQVASDLALKLLCVMKNLGLEPTSQTYTNAVLSLTHERYRRDYAAEVACSLLDELKQADADPDKKAHFADAQIFSTVLNILSFAKTNNSADKACEVLNDMFRLYASGRPEVEPTERCLDNCLSALCATGDGDYILRAFEVFRSLGSKINSKGFQYLPSENGVKALAESCLKAGLKVESDEVLNFWKNTENITVA